MIAISAAAEQTVTRAEVSDWLKKESDPDYQKFPDKQLAIFLNGLINEKRGKKDGPQPDPETRLTNNIIFMKLKIALDLKADDILEILLKSDFRLSKHELSAFFRKPGHKHHRECKEQILRNFLQGLQIMYRDEDKPESADEPESEDKPDSEDKPEPEVESVWGKGRSKKT